jgi:hypothetical protein
MVERAPAPAAAVAAVEAARPRLPDEVAVRVVVVEVPAVFEVGPGLGRHQGKHGEDGGGEEKDEAPGAGRERRAGRHQDLLSGFEVSG